MNGPALPTGPPPVVVPEHGRFSGLVTFVGNAQIDGEVEGRVVANGTLVLSETARVVAQIEVGELVVAGRFDGDARARRVELQSAARVRGSVQADVLALADGSFFEGRCCAGPLGQRGEDASPEGAGAASGSADSS